MVETIEFFNCFWLLFFRVKRKVTKRKPVSRVTLRVAKPANDAAPHAAMRRCPTRSGAHNLAIAARLASLGRLAWQHDACFIDWFFYVERVGIRFAQTSRCAISVHIPDARRGTNGYKPKE